MQEKEPKITKIKDHVIGIIQDASENYAHVQRNIRALQGLHSQHGDEVNTWIEICLSKVLQAKCGLRNAEGALKFLDLYFKKGFNGTGKKLEAFNEAQTKLKFSLLESVLSGIDDQEKHVRYRSCQLIALILNHLEELDEDVYQKLRAQLAARIRCKDPDVRAQAVMAISRLQDSGNFHGNKDVMNNILDAMQKDPNPSVRKSALWNIDANKATLPLIIKMASDTDPRIRSSVFKKFNKEQLSYTLLSMEQRENLLYKGLSDSNREVVKSAIRLLLESWGHNNNNSVPEILKNLLNVTESRASSLVIRSLLEAGFKIGVDHNDKFHNITAEEVYTIRIAWDHYNKLKNFDALETLLLPVNKNIEYLEYWYTSMINSNNSKHEEFIIEQLLELAKRQDYSDELLRTATIEYFEKLLSTGTVLIFPKIYSIMQLLYIVYSDNVSWCKKALDLATPHNFLSRDDISKLFPIDQSQLRSSISSTIIRDEFDADSADAPEELVRCFEVAKTVFRILDIGYLEDKHLLRLIECILRDLVYPALHSRNFSIYILGLQTFSIYIISNKDLFAKYVHLFNKDTFNNSQIMNETIKVLTDGALLYGAASISSPENVLHNLLDIALGSSDDNMLLLGTKAAAKLLLFGRIADENIVKRLCLIYLLSKDSGQIDLHECLSQFFSIFPAQSCSNNILMQKLFVPIVEELCLCMDDESPSEATQYIYKCAASVMDIISSPRKEGNEKADIYDILPFIVLEGLLVHLEHKVIRPVLCNIIQDPYLLRCNIDPARIKYLKTLSVKLATHLSAKERKVLMYMVKGHGSPNFECAA